MVNVIQAEGLQHMNHFTGDHPYVVCEVKHTDPSAPKSKAETTPVNEGDTLNPVWNETLELEPWVPGEPLHVTVYDKGLLGSKTEGKALLPSDLFYPNAFRGLVSIIGLPEAKIRLEISSSIGATMQGQVSGMTTAMPMTHQAATCADVPASTYEAPAPAASSQFSTAYAAGTYQSQGMAMPSMVQTSGPEQLSVSILQAHGLKHMNHFTGDHPYVTCQVRHLDEHTELVKVETKPVTEGDTLNPFWGETHTLGPWSPGEALEFTVYDKGLVGAKTEGKVVVTPEFFYPQGFSGMLAISGLPHATLHVIIRPLGAMVTEAPAAETLVADATDASKKKKNKKTVKVGKKNKGCC